MPGQYYDKIEFWDEATQQLIKTVDLEEMNPFNALPFKVIGNSYGANRYDLSDIDRAELERFIDISDVPETIADQTPVVADGQIMVFDGPTMENFTVAAYNLYLTNRYGQVIIIMCEYHVFNDQGEVVSVIKSNRGGASPIVTQDGQYLAVKYGGAYDACGSKGLEEGLLFFDVESGKVIYEDSLSHGRWIYYFPILNYIVSIEKTGGGMNGKQHFSIYKLEERVKYYRVFDYRLLGRPGVVVKDDYEEDGVFYSLYEIDGKRYEHGAVRRRAYFDEDFKITNF